MIIEGVVVKNIDFLESSKIIYLYTKEGIKSILIKGAKRMKSHFRSFTLTFAYISCEVTNSKLPVLKDGDIIENFSNIQNNFKNNLYGSYLAELLIKQPTFDNGNIYEFFIKCLRFEDTELIAIIFSLKYLYILGFAPQFVCMCGKQKNILGFCIKDGHLICPNCNDNIKKLIDIETTLIVKKLYSIDIEKDEMPIINDNKRKELWSFLFDYYIWNVGFESKVLKLV